MFSGSYGAEALSSFFDQFAGGDKCRKMFRLDASTDLSKLRIAQLKDLLEQHGQKCFNCVEKSDYVKRVRETLGLAAGGAGGGTDEL